MKFLLWHNFDSIKHAMKNSAMKNFTGRGGVNCHSMSGTSFGAVFKRGPEFLLHFKPFNVKIHFSAYPEI